MLLICYKSLTKPVKDFEFLVKGKYNIVFILKRGCPLCDDILPLVYEKLRKIKNQEIIVSVVTLNKNNNNELTVLKNKQLLKKLFINKVPAVVFYNKKLDIIYVLKKGSLVLAFCKELEDAVDKKNVVDKYLVSKELNYNNVIEERAVLFLDSSCNYSKNLLEQLTKLPQKEKNKFKIYCQKNESNEFLKMLEGFSVEYLEQYQFLNDFNVSSFPTLSIQTKYGKTFIYGVTMQKINKIFKEVKDE